MGDGANQSKEDGRAAERTDVDEGGEQEKRRMGG